MINSINRIFINETSLFDIDSPMLLEEHARVQSKIQFKWVWQKIKTVLAENN